MLAEQLNIFEQFTDMLDFHNLDYDEIKSVEQNCGTIWITMKDGRMFALSLMESASE